MKRKLDWSKVWREFNKWMKRRDQGPFYPDWAAQQRALKRIVNQQLAG